MKTTATMYDLIAVLRESDEEFRYKDQWTLEKGIRCILQQLKDPHFSDLKNLQLPMTCMDEVIRYLDLVLLDEEIKS